MITVFAMHKRALVLGTCAATATFVLFYLMTVFALSWGTRALGFARKDFLLVQMFGVLFLAITIPVSAVLADWRGCRPVLMVATAAIGAFGLVFGPLFGSGSLLGVCTFMALGLALMGLTYGPLGAALAQLFPTAVRYTGASLAFNLAGILGASLAPYIATSLAGRYGLAFVGYYLSSAAVLTFVALWHMRPMRLGAATSSAVTL
jgi:MFS family permease